MKYRIEEIPGGLAGTDKTLLRMGELVRDSLRRGRIRLTALSIIERANVPPGNDLALARSLFESVRATIRYIRDPIGVETLQSPAVTLRLRAGDCDDHSVLLAALAMSVGLPVRWRVIGPSPDRFNHIYLEILADGRWNAADTTIKNPFGRAPAHSGASKVYNFEGEGVNMLGNHSLSAVTPLTNRFRTGAVRPLRSARLTSPGPKGFAHGLPISVAEKLVAQSVKKTLTNNWRNGLINRNDLLSYLRVIREGNAPFTGSPFFVNTITAGIKLFHRDMDARGINPVKPESQNASLGELDGFLSSIWNGVKSVVSSGVKIATGFVAGGPVGAVGVAAGEIIPKGGSAGPIDTGYVAPRAAPTSLVSFQPNINFPQGIISTIIPPETGKAAVTEFLTSPIFLGGLAILAIGIFFVAKK